MADDRQARLLVRTMGEAAARASLAASGRAETISGEVRISVTDVMANYVMPQVLDELRTKAPQIRIDVLISDSLSDLQRREADIAVRHVAPSQPDLIARKVTREDETIDLLPREFSILEHLLRRKGRVQTRTMLLEAIWDISFDPMTNVVETHISRLRAKVDKPFETDLIKTVRGAGYRIDA